MKTKINSTIALLLLTGLSLYSQTPQRNAPVQVSFVYPLGSHGFNSVNIIYDFSLNLLAGNTGGVDGFECAGLVNINRGDVSGFQVGGIGNITGGNVSGMQVGGIFSIADSVDGMQVGGIYSQASKSEGLQLGGIMNISAKAENSIAGLINVNGSLQKGIQIAGIYNQTGELDGLQIGLINVSDTISKGLSIGLINIIKKGHYNEFALSIADYQHIGFTYRHGLKRFYTVYTAGMNYLQEQLWVFGLGVGHLQEVNPRFSLQPEIVWYTYFPTDFRGKIRETYMTQFKLGFVRTLSPDFSVSFSPGLYLAWKSNRDTFDEYGYDQSPIGPIVDVKRAGNSNLLEFGVGLSVALHFTGLR